MSNDKYKIPYGGASWGHLDEEQQWRFKEALFESKGSANNQLGALLAIAGAPAKDIAKYASKATGEKVLTHSFLKHKIDKDERIARSVFKTVPNFWDTVKGRKLKEKGEILDKVGLDPSKPLPVAQLDVNMSEKALQVAFRMSGRTYTYCDELRMLRYDSTIAGKFAMVDLFEPLADVNFADDITLIRLSEHTNLTNVNTFKGYVEYRKQDIDSLAHLDPAVAEKMEPERLFADIVRSGFSHCYGNGTKYGIEIECVTEAFYEVCAEMGIVGVLDLASPGRQYITQAATLGVMKNVIKLAGTYRRLVKGGFAESVARETTLAEINENIAKRATRPSVRFYGRNDIEDTPEEERAKAKRTSGGNGNGNGNGNGRSRMLTLDEFVKAISSKGEGEGEA